MTSVPIERIKLNPMNPRTISESRFAKLKKSLQDFPGMLDKRPLVVYTDTDGFYVVLGGNMRLRAAQELGFKALPIIVADDWTIEQKSEFLIKDNLSFGEWDMDTLANEWNVEDLSDWGMELPNFDVIKEVPVSEHVSNRELDKMLDTYNNALIKQIVLYYEHEEYAYLMEKLDEIGKKRDLDDNSSVVKYLVDKFIANESSDTEPQ